MKKTTSSSLDQLTNNAGQNTELKWSPEGSWLAFVSNRGEDIDVYKICATCPVDAVTVRLTDEAQPASWPAWSPDGQSLAYVAGQDLMKVNEDRSGVSFLAGGVFGPSIWRP